MADAILPLPPGVAAKIKSSIAISSLNAVVLELLCNSLDASAIRVEIIVDYRLGRCSVKDDGHGIRPEEFRSDGGLGKQYYTSKHQGERTTYGGDGSFLSSLAELSLLKITSKHHAYRSQNTLILHQGKPVSRLQPTPDAQAVPFLDHGTEVSVRDLFANMPVRVKERSLLKEQQNPFRHDWMRLKHDIVSILLAWRNGVHLSVLDVMNDRKIVLDIRRVQPTGLERTLFKRPGSEAGLIAKTLLTQARYMTTDIWHSWHALSANTSQIRITALVSTIPVSTKKIQFISVGIKPVSNHSSHNYLFDDINHVFAASAFGVVDDPGTSDTAHEMTPTKTRQQSGIPAAGKATGRKGVDRWPMYCVQIEHVAGEGDQRASFVDDPKISDKISVLLEDMFHEFLQEHLFRSQRKKLRSSQRFENKHVQTTLSNVTMATRSNSCAETAFPFALTSEIGDGKKHPVQRSQPKPLATDILEWNNAQLPKLQSLDKNASSRNFKNWSRIKMGRPASSVDKTHKLGVRAGAVQPSADKKKPPVLLSQCSMSEKISMSSKPSAIAIAEDRRDVESPIIQRQAMDLDEEIDSVAPVETQDLHNGDQSLFWQDATTKKQYFLNSRTGGMFATQTIRPRTAPASSAGARSLGSLSGTGRRLTNKKPLSSGEPLRSPWVDGFLKSWENPVFNPTESPIPQIANDSMTSSMHEGFDTTCCRIIPTHRAQFDINTESAKVDISQKELKMAQVVAQVDRKFILVKITTQKSSEEKTMNTDGTSTLLVLIDQHAADERCRVEELLKSYFSATKAAQDREFESCVQMSKFDRPLIFQPSAEELELFRLYQQHFAKWAILYSIEPSQKRKSTSDIVLHISRVPSAIFSRCKAEPKLLLDLLRSELWRCHEGEIDTHTTLKTPVGNGGGDWLKAMAFCPPGISDMINSRACRSAIMFNDELTTSECQNLVLRLADCKLPFQCAHGRPSMVPLLSLGSSISGDRISRMISPTEVDDMPYRSQKFSEAWNAWDISCTEDG